MENLDGLAVKICDSFLEIRDSKHYEKDNPIGLYGADESTLKTLKSKMENYFKSKNEKFKIVLEDKGYPFHVGWCLRTFFNKTHKLN